MNLSDAAFWSRFQFGFTITYHYLFPQLTMGLAWFRVEADTILGDLLERGRKHGVSAPIVQAAFVSLTIYQQGRRA
jgi:hypothetical protein